MPSIRSATVIRAILEFAQYPSRIPGARMSKIEKRLFVVGCARSGTTLVQAMLASHSQIHAFPETFFSWMGIFRHSPIESYSTDSCASNRRYALQNALHRLGEEHALVAKLSTRTRLVETLYAHWIAWPWPTVAPYGARRRRGM